MFRHPLFSRVIKMKDREKMADQVREIYEQAVAVFRDGDYAAAMDGVRKIYILQPGCLRGLLLEAYIHRARQAWSSEIHALQQITSFAAQNGVMDISLLATAWSLLGSAWSAVGESTAARKAFLHSVEFEKDEAQRLQEYSNAIFVTNHDSAGDDLNVMRSLYAGYRKLLHNIRPFPVRRYTHKKLRIGYLSADFRLHPVAYFIASLLTGFDRESFVVYCYAANQETDEVTSYFQHHVSVWRDVSQQSHARCAETIWADEIDILVDLAGHTGKNLLPVLAYHPATIQISGIGYMNSTGMESVEYFLGDIFLDGAAKNVFFTEHVLRLPHTHFCYSRLHSFPEAGEAPCRKNGGITLGCFNNFAKVTDDMLVLWNVILQSLDDARLLLKHKMFDSQEGRALALRRLQAAGIPAKKVELQGFSKDYLKSYHAVDIALDTYPYTGGITTFEALYMGVPVVSLYGKRHGTRFGYSLLSNAGIGELAVSSPNDYVERVVALARDKELLGLLHQQLRIMVEQSPLMDQKQYVQDVESLYRMISEER